MNRIIEDIDSGNLESARREIEKMEKKLTLEPSPRVRERLKTEITRLKKRYSDKLEVSIPSTVEVEPSELKIKPTCSFGGNDEKVLIENRENERIYSFNCRYVDVNECTDVETELIKCEETAFLKNVNRSKVYLRVKYLRLVGCTELYLKIESASGIYLQNSKNITLELPRNHQIQVFDFDSPVQSQNYRTITN